MPARTSGSRSQDVPQIYRGTRPRSASPKPICRTSSFCPQPSDRRLPEDKWFRPGSRIPPARSHWHRDPDKPGRAPPRASKDYEFEPLPRLFQRRVQPLPGQGHHSATTPAEPPPRCACLDSRSPARPSLHRWAQFHTCHDFSAVEIHDIIRSEAGGTLLG